MESHIKDKPFTEEGVLKDGQKIDYLSFPDGKGEGSGGGTQIIVAHEKGFGDMMLWFSVFKNGVLVRKINAAYVEGIAIYQKESKGEK